MDLSLELKPGLFSLDSVAWVAQSPTLSESLATLADLLIAAYRQRSNALETLDSRGFSYRIDRLVLRSDVCEFSFSAVLSVPEEATAENPDPQEVSSLSLALHRVVLASISPEIPTLLITIEQEVR